MRIPISKARAMLPRLVKKLEKDSGITYEITVHDDVVAELKAPPRIKPGQSAKKLLKIMEQLPKGKASQKVRDSEQIGRYLYGKEK